MNSLINGSPKNIICYIIIVWYIIIIVVIIVIIITKIIIIAIISNIIIIAIIIIIIIFINILITIIIIIIMFFIIINIIIVIWYFIVWNIICNTITPGIFTLTFRNLFTDQIPRKFWKTQKLRCKANIWRIRNLLCVATPDTELCILDIHLNTSASKVTEANMKMSFQTNIFTK